LSFRPVFLKEGRQGGREGGVRGKREGAREGYAYLDHAS
jgi:hypothetical protein